MTNSSPASWEWCTLPSTSGPPAPGQGRDAVLLDVNELTDNAISFSATCFPPASKRRQGWRADYKDLVNQKLHTAEGRFMADQFNQSRAFVLELMVVVILVIELVFLFGGKV